MNTQQLNEELKNIDIYLLDQILKERYKLEDSILDVGFGKGRNMCWFVANGYNIHGVEKKEEHIAYVHDKLRNINAIYNLENLRQGSLDAIPHADASFDHVICNAVLHFAKSDDQFFHWMAELSRVLKRGGSLFVRMTSDIGLEAKAESLGSGVFNIPDGSKRYLLNHETLGKVMDKQNLEFIEELKTVNVNNKRCMTTLVLRKL